MQVNEEKHAVIHSCVYWNNTEILFEKGCRYTIYADPPEQTWVDGKIFSQTCKANGFSNVFLNVFSYLKRFRNAKWFCMIGSIDTDENTLFKIGLKIDNYSAPKSGILQCFANDAKKHYGNNSGNINLIVKRIS